MNFSALPESNWIGRLLRRVLRVIPMGMRMPILQGPAFGLSWVVGAGNHGCWLGTYEYKKSRLFAQSINRGDVVFDIGAHVGYYTLIAARRSGKNGRVICFEPLPENLSFLNQHITINRMGCVSVINKAVGARNGTAKFSIAKNRYQGRIANDGQIEVEVAALDILWRNEIIPTPNVIKMDIEGAEFDALQGACELLQASHPKIFLSTHSEQVHRKCCEFLESLSYRLSFPEADELTATV